MLRRLVGLSLSVLVLLLNFRASDLRCADHAVSSGAHETAADHNVIAMHPHHAANAVNAADKSCETPATRDCCKALTSCSMTFGISGTAVTALHLVERDVARSTTRLPASLVYAPEPPPPRL